MKNPGLILELRVGESICIQGTNGVDSEPILLTLEMKDGRKARVRVIANKAVKVKKQISCTPLNL